MPLPGGLTRFRYKNAKTPRATSSKDDGCANHQFLLVLLFGEALLSFGFFCS